MIINGKAKEDFKKYIYNIRHMYDNSLTSQKYALIIEWFDSVGIYICLENHYKNFGYKIQDKGNIVLYDHMFAIHSRQEATKQAILKCNEIYN